MRFSVELEVGFDVLLKINVLASSSTLAASREREARLFPLSSFLEWGFFSFLFGSGIIY